MRILMLKLIKVFENFYRYFIVWINSLVNYERKVVFFYLGNYKGLYIVFFIFFVVLF